MYEASGYWDKRFEEGEIWGNDPSLSALMAAEFFKKYNLKSVLVPGCGYGRNSMYFAKKGFSVTGFDISSIGVSIAKRNAIKYAFNIRYEVRDALYPVDEKYDAIFAHNLLHLFLKDDRFKLLRIFEECLRTSGIIAVNVFSIKDDEYGGGNFIEENTFYTPDGHYSHFFTEDEVLKYFSNFKLLELKQIEEIENHGRKGEHKHVFLFGAFKLL